ncbi:MAG: hypothetical protein ACI8XO_002669 [Verrucomicrobiales bacterium]|jgi:hypothetical protein
MTDTDPTEQNPTRSDPFAKAEAIFRRTRSLRGMTIRTDNLSGGMRLSMGHDCENAMATFRAM